MRFKRIFTIVLDSCGVGYLPDANKYKDEGADTLGHICDNYPNLAIPTMQKMGIGNLKPLKDVPAVDNPSGYYGKCGEASVGKDTMTGHWEIMGLKISEPFLTFTDTGFPKELIDELEQRTGYKVIGNKSASGTAILDELGERHMQTKEIIVYTSADSVLQIAAHEETFGLDELYRCCEIARDITMKPEWKVGRIIARPFVGPCAGQFVRTSNRHDYALAPFGKTVLDTLKENDFDVIGVGKINDIFNGAGITETYHSDSSDHGMVQTIELAQKDFTGLCFTNLVDFDAKWGHRRNVEGYAKELENFDQRLNELLPYLNDEDLVILTADHGNDPTWSGTDHTREYIPTIYYSKAFTHGGSLLTGKTFANIGATIADNFNVDLPENGKSILELLK